MKIKRPQGNENGFTLIESIVSLVMVSIVAAMLFTFSQPLYDSARTFGWFNDELKLQQSMEQILADYKSQRNDGSNPFDPGVFRSYIVGKYPLVNVAKTGFITFNSTYTATWPPQVYMPAGEPPVLIITVELNGKTLSMILT